MSKRRWLTAHEARSLFWRSAGVGVAAITGFVSIKVFLDQHPHEAPGLVAMAGWLVFLPLLQLGLGRPIYSLLRRRHVEGSPLERQARRALAWFGALAALGVVVHAALAVWIVVVRQNGSLGVFDVGMLAAGLAANATGVFQRDLSYAISIENRYERLELLRRSSVLAGYALLWAGVPMAIVGAALMAVGSATQFAGARTALPSPSRDSVSGEPMFSGIGRDAARYWVFSINELLLYNLPLVVFTLAGAGPELVYIGIWIRIFQLVVLPMRMLVDARVNRQTAAFFDGDFALARREVGASVWLALASVVVALLVLWLLQGPLLAWIGADSITNDRWLLAAVTVWGIGNALQHVYGSFTLSHGRGFSFALKASTAAMLLAGVTFLLARAAGWSVGPALLAMGMAYALTALPYRRHVLRLLAANANRPT